MTAPGEQMSRQRRNAGTALMLAALCALAMAIAWRHSAFHWLDATFGNRPLNAAHSWHYHLTRLDLETIETSPADLIVTEYSANVPPFHAWTPEEVARMKVRPGGAKRPVLAYFSIGEAESYRTYWRPEWTGDGAPGWLGPENCAWPRNYLVRFWHDGWKDIIYRDQSSFLRRIVDAGFDGVYLDRIDAYSELEKEHPAAREEMIQFVTELAATGRRLKPGFLVVAQNGEDLLADWHYRDVLDGLGKEDLLYGSDGTNTRNRTDAANDAMRLLRRLRGDWKPVFAVEYVTEPALVAGARQQLAGLGLVPTIAHRSLDGRPPGEARPPSTIKYGTPEWIEANCKDKPHW